MFQTRHVNHKVILLILKNYFSFFFPILKQPQKNIIICQNNFTCEKQSFVV